MLIIWVVLTTVVFHFISETVNKTSILDLQIIRVEVYWGCGFKGQSEINIACNVKNIKYLTIQLYYIFLKLLVESNPYILGMCA